MYQLNQSQPALPCQATGDGVNYIEGYRYTLDKGLTKLELSATLIAQGLCSNPNWCKQLEREYEDIATYSLIIASRILRKETTSNDRKNR